MRIRAELWRAGAPFQKRVQNNYTWPGGTRNSTGPKFAWKSYETICNCARGTIERVSKQHLQILLYRLFLLLLQFSPLSLPLEHWWVHLHNNSSTTHSHAGPPHTPPETIIAPFAAGAAAAAARTSVGRRPHVRALGRFAAIFATGRWRFFATGPFSGDSPTSRAPPEASRGPFSPGNRPKLRHVFGGGRASSNSGQMCSRSGVRAAAIGAGAGAEKDEAIHTHTTNSWGRQTQCDKSANIFSRANFFHEPETREPAPVSAESINVVSEAVFGRRFSLMSD